MPAIVRTAALAIAALALVACTGQNTTVSADSGQVAQGYTPIHAIDDCGALGAEADRFVAKAAAFYAVDDLGNAGLANYFAASAGERMVALGCFQ